MVRCLDRSDAGLYTARHSSAHICMQCVCSPYQITIPLYSCLSWHETKLIYVIVLEGVIDDNTLHDVPNVHYGI